MNENIKLTCKAVKYYSMLDEAAFFEWIEKIPSIIKYDGIHDELYLYLKNKDIPSHDLRELLGLFRRYKIDLSQLRIFLSEQNEEWLAGKPQGFWHKKVLETIKKTLNQK